MSHTELKMNDQKLQQIIEQGIKEAHITGIQLGKKESSDLYSDLKSLTNEVKGELKGINEHLKTLNGSVAKHTDKLAQNDIINAQTTMSLQQLATSLQEMKTTDLATLKKREEENSDFRKSTSTTLGNFKWLVGAIGIGNVGIILKLFIQ